MINCNKTKECRKLIFCGVAIAISLDFRAQNEEIRLSVN